MLKFEFMQPGEFDDPHYDVADNDVMTESGNGHKINRSIGSIEYFEVVEQWKISFCDDIVYDSSALLDIAKKLDELNESTRAQRILGVF